MPVQVLDKGVEARFVCFSGHLLTDCNARRREPLHQGTCFNSLLGCSYCYHLTFE